MSYSERFANSVLDRARPANLMLDSEISPPAAARRATAAPAPARARSSVPCPSPAKAFAPRTSGAVPAAGQ